MRREAHKLNEELIEQIQDNFDAWVATLMDEGDPEDHQLIWEFKRYIDHKKLRIAAGRNEGIDNLEAVIAFR